MLPLAVEDLDGEDGIRSNFHFTVGWEPQMQRRVEDDRESCRRLELDERTEQ